MFIAIIIGDGNKMSPDYKLQAEEFVSYGIALAHCFESVDVGLYVLESRTDLIDPYKPKDILSHMTIKVYKDAIDLKKSLSSHTDKMCLIVIGHGMASDWAGGSVGLCWTGNTHQMNITALDINDIHPAVYMGLHCHSGDLTGRLSDDIFWVDLTGKQTGRNSDISTFVDEAKKGALTLAELVAAEFSEGSEQKDHAMSFVEKIKTVLKATRNGASSTNSVESLLKGLNRRH